MDVLELVLILCCWSLLWVQPQAEPEAAQPLEYQACIWKEKLQSNDPSAFLELCAWSGGQLLNCHMHCANIPRNVGHGSVDLSWGFWLPVAEPSSSPAEKPPGASSLTIPRLSRSSEQGGNVLLPFCHPLEAGMGLGKKKGRMDYSFPSPSLPSGEKTHTQTWNRRGNQNKHPEHVTLSEMFLLSFWAVLFLIISSGGNQHFMEKCFPISFA